MLVLSATTLRIDLSSILAYQASVRPIRLQQSFLSMWFKVEGQVVEWPTSTFPIGRGVCSRCHISTLQLTLVGAASTLGHALRVGEQRKMAAHAKAPAVQWGSYLFPLLWNQWVAGVMKPSTIASIGRLQGQRLGIPPSESIQHFFQRLAISLWIENVTLWIHRQPVRPANVDGLI